LPGSKSDVSKYSAIFPQGDFILGTAIEVIENDSGEALAR
jgi:hypothetical protein